jgi:hypothetical protein
VASPGICGSWFDRFSFLRLNSLKPSLSLLLERGTEVCGLTSLSNVPEFAPNSAMISFNCPFGSNLLSDPGPLLELWDRSMRHLTGANLILAGLNVGWALPLNWVCH